MELFNLDCFVDAVAPAGKPFSCDRRYIVALQFLDYPLVLLQSAGVDDDACLELGTGKRCVVEADAAELDFLLTQVPTSVMLLDASTQPRPQLIAMGTVDVVPEADVPQTQHVRLYDHFGKHVATAAAYITLRSHDAAGSAAGAEWADVAAWAGTAAASNHKPSKPGAFGGASEPGAGIAGASGLLGMRVPPHLHFANHGLLSQLGSSDQGTGQLRSSWDTAAREQLPAGLPQRPVVHHSSTSSPAKLRFAGDAPSRAPKKKAAAKQPGGSSPAKAAAAALNSRAARDVPAAWQADSGVSRLQQQWCQQDVAPASSYGYAAGQEQARWHAGAAAKQAPSTRGINAAEARRAALARAAAKRSRQPGGPAGPAAEDSQVTVASQGAGAGPPSAAAGPAAADVSPTAEGVQQATRNGVSMATSMVFELVTLMSMRAVLSQAVNAMSAQVNTVVTQALQQQLAGLGTAVSAVLAPAVQAAAAAATAPAAAAPVPVARPAAATGPAASAAAVGAAARPDAHPPGVDASSQESSRVQSPAVFALPPQLPCFQVQGSPSSTSTSPAPSGGSARSRSGSSGAGAAGGLAAEMAEASRAWDSLASHMIYKVQAGSSQGSGPGSSAEGSPRTASPLQPSRLAEQAAPQQQPARNSSIVSRAESAYSESFEEDYEDALPAAGAQGSAMEQKGSGQLAGIPEEESVSDISSLSAERSARAAAARARDMSRVTTRTLSLDSELGEMLGSGEIHVEAREEVTGWQAAARPAPLKQGSRRMSHYSDVSFLSSAEGSPPDSPKLRHSGGGIGSAAARPAAAGAGDSWAALISQAGTAGREEQLVEDEAGAEVLQLGETLSYMTHRSSEVGDEAAASAWQLPATSVERPKTSGKRPGSAAAAQQHPHPAAPWGVAARAGGGGGKQLAAGEVEEGSEGAGDDWVGGIKAGYHGSSGYEEEEEEEQYMAQEESCGRQVEQTMKRPAGGRQQQAPWQHAKRESSDLGDIMAEISDLSSVRSTGSGGGGWGQQAAVAW